jgi:hypothetical protein
MSESRTSGRSPFGRRVDRTGSVEVFIRPERSVLVRLVAVLWHLRTELAASVVGVWIWLRLTDRMPVWAAITLLVVTTGGLIAWGPVAAVSGRARPRQSYHVSVVNRRSPDGASVSMACTTSLPAVCACLTGEFRHLYRGHDQVVCLCRSGCDLCLRRPPNMGLR